MTNLKDLDGRLIELSIPIFCENKLGVYMGFRVGTIGRVVVNHGDRDCAEHICIGSAILPIEAVVKCDIFYNQYELVVPVH